MHTNKLRLLACSILAAGAMSGTGSAANSAYAPGDMVLFFLQSGGTSTVYVNLGPATGFRGSATGPNGPNQLNIAQIGSTLSAPEVYGPGWASDTTVFAGVAGVFSTSTSGTAQTNGDPGRTLYVSKPRTAIGTVGSPNSSLGSFTNASMTIAATSIETQNNVFENNHEGTISVSPTATSGIDDANLINLAGNASTSFGAISGGVHQKGQATDFGTSGPVSNVEFMLDVYRVQAVSTANVPSNQVGFDDTAINRRGTYEGTVVISGSGAVSWIAVPEPSTMALAGLSGLAALTRRRRAH